MSVKTSTMVLLNKHVHQATIEEALTEYDDVDEKIIIYSDSDIMSSAEAQQKLNRYLDNEQHFMVSCSSFSLKWICLFGRMEAANC